MDLSQKKLYITTLYRVIASSMNHHYKSGNKNERPCDGFVYVLDGECRYKFNDKTNFTVTKGDIVYLAAGSCYTIKVLTDVYSYIYCDFDFSEKCPDMSCRVAAGNPGETESIMRQLLRAYSRNRFTDSLSLLYKIYGALQASISSAYVGKGARGYLEKSRKKIDWAYSDYSLSVSALAKEAGVSEVYYRKLFKALYHTSPSEYIISVRLRAAEELMQFTSLPLKECAMRCGFSSLQYFSRVYRKKRGTTPSRWRKENQSLTP